MNYKVVFSATQQVCAEGVGFVGVVDKVNLSKTGFGSYRHGLCIGQKSCHRRLGGFSGCFRDFWRHSAGLDRFFMSSECDLICLLWIIWLPSCSSLMFSADPVPQAGSADTELEPHSERRHREKDRFL